VPIAVEHGPSIHDCAITPRFAVILDLPVTFSMKALIGGHRFPFAWNPAHRARVGLLPRSGKAEPIWCDVDPCYVFHAANAYDADDGTVILDVVAYDTMFAESRRGPDATGRFERWTINPATRGVTRRIIDTSPQEFPRGDERRLGQPYRYAYAIAVPDDGNDQLIGATALYKHDLETGGRQVHDFGPGRFPGEFVFVPDAPDSREDEGWLIGLVIDMPRQTTDLVILDASAIAAPPVGSIRIPHRVPPGFHGNFLPRHETTGA
jgi:carotenoid cleavage dioxygenase